MDMTPHQLGELIAATLKDFREVHQVEIDRRFDRLAGRIAELERICCVDSPKTEIPEADLLTRRLIAELRRDLRNAGIL